MKRQFLFVLMAVSFVFFLTVCSAEESALTPVVSQVVVPEAKAAEAVEALPADVAVPIAAPLTEEAAEPAVNENLEFVSGEVAAVDAVAKSVTIKLAGDTEENVTEKSLTVTTDASTDITDGEKDRELGSLSAGTEVDVEYDPATKKATYIFVY